MKKYIQPEMEVLCLRLEGTIAVSNMNVHYDQEGDADVFTSKKDMLGDSNPWE